MLTPVGAPDTPVPDNLFESAKAILGEHHVSTVTWHLTLNNHSSTRPKAHGGHLVRSLTDHKTWTDRGPGSASPRYECTLRLPNSFRPGDGVSLIAVGKERRKIWHQEPHATQRWRAFCSLIPPRSFCVKGIGSVPRGTSWLHFATSGHAQRASLRASLWQCKRAQVCANKARMCSVVAGPQGRDSHLI